jgi:16S rRNA (uracil1498-N3)-methyltransferase
VLAVIKFDRMEWAIEKCTELGVCRFIPLVAARSDTHLASASSKRVERWRRIAREASEQSRRIAPPEIENPLGLNEIIGLSQCGIWLSESDKTNPLMNLLRTRFKDENELFLAIGPEGGWTEGEQELFKESGWSSASLGATILRTETAAIAATAIATQLQ